MPLTAGTKLGQYEVVEAIGAGGMGEVYRARDTKLGRDVAIKVLPEEFARDKERLERFEREARLLAQLNHANIATLYGLEEHDGQKFIVMELVEGETLAERIAKGSIPVDEAIPLFIQIAEGLEAAHDKAIIHRDLKPANIKIGEDGKPKILDFGLAKAFVRVQGSDSDSSQSPTLTKGTALGAIMGTSSYMSPEQATGRPVDRRTDVWAFGCCLYEALTGKKAFDGETATDAIAAVVKSDPDWAALPSTSPWRLRELLERCLTKERKERLRDAGDAIYELRASSRPGTPQRRGRAGYQGVRLVVAVVFGAAIAGIAARYQKSVPATRVQRFTIPLTRADGMVPWGHSLAFSPDGQTLAYVGGGEINRKLFLRSLERLDAVEVAGARAVLHPVFSPDGASIAYTAKGSLHVIPVDASDRLPTTRPLPSESNFGGGMDWLPDGSLVIGIWGEGLFRVSSDRTEQEVLVRQDSASRPLLWPHVLPGGHAVLFAVHSSEDPVNESRIEAYDFENGETKLIMEAAGNPVYASTGHLLFAHGSTLMAAPFDEVALVVTGAAVPVVESVYMADPSGSMNFAISNDGTLAYTPEGNNPPHSTIVSVDRSGRESSILDTARDFEGPRLSPDEQRIAVSLADADGGRDVWILDRTRGNLSRLTFDLFASEIVWRSDGERLAFAALGGGLAYNAFSTSADGSGEPEPLTFEQRVVWPTSFTPDGAGLILSVLASHHKDIGYVELGKNAEVKYLLETDFDEISPRLSPDGRWLAYVSDESGEREVYAQRFPDGRDKQQVSVNSGTEPVWSANGEELFFRETERMMVVSISSANRLTLGTPTVLFEGPYLPAWGNSLSANYDVSPDGEEFIMLRPEGGALRQEIVIVLNWFHELERLVPTEN